MREMAVDRFECLKVLNRAFLVDACRTRFALFECQYLKSIAINHIAVFTPNNVIIGGIRLVNKHVLWEVMSKLLTTAICNAPAIRI